MKGTLKRMAKAVDKQNAGSGSGAVAVWAPWLQAVA